MVSEKLSLRTASYNTLYNTNHCKFNYCSVEVDTTAGKSISHVASLAIKLACKTNSLIKLQFLRVIYSTMNESFNRLGVL